MSNILTPSEEIVRDSSKRMNAISNKATRLKMHGYWEEFSPTLESMMLDKTASLINTDEQEEILAYLPDIKNKNVLELGAGIGRFTEHLASTAKNVTAVDFMKEYIDVNRRKNGHRQNVTFIAADVMDLQLSPKKFDVVFSNWLLMYLNDVECVKLLQKILYWLTEDGFLFIRESCFHSSGNMKRTMNPTFYRAPIDYQNLLDTVTLTHTDFRNSASTYGFHVVESGSIMTYVKHKNNSYQIYFLSKKMEKEENAKDSFQQFLDQRQYTRKGVLRYEWIFGKTFLSTGGMKTTENKFMKLLDLKPGQKVLDIGCGIGGHDFYMVEEFGVQVLGVDLSANMMSVAIEHLAERPHLNNVIKFVMCDITKATYEEGSFDAVYSRDTFLHIEQKEQLFKNILRWLKPGGKIFFTDYARGEKPQSEEMREYVEQRGYYLLTVNEYEELLLRIGFVKVQADDKTGEFLNALKDELNKLRSRKSEFLQEFSEEDFHYLDSGWEDKVQRAASGDQIWVACYAEKGTK